MKLVRMLRAGLPAMLAGCMAAQIASADVYTWVDAAGGFNISNLTPPADARVISVTREAEPNAAARDALRDAEVRALAERVRQLQDEVAQGAARAASSAPSYQIVTQPPPAQYAPQYSSDWLAAQYEAQYQAQYEPQYEPQYTTYSPGYGCYTWLNCGGAWWGVPFYVPTVVVVRPPRYQPPYPTPIHGGYPKGGRPPVAGQPPMAMRPPMPGQPPIATRPPMQPQPPMATRPPMSTPPPMRASAEVRRG